MPQNKQGQATFQAIRFLFPFEHRSIGCGPVIFRFGQGPDSLVRLDAKASDKLGHRVCGFAQVAVEGLAQKIPVFFGLVWIGWRPSDYWSCGTNSPLNSGSA